jgi:hypothetical protein
MTRSNSATGEDRLAGANVLPRRVKDLIKSGMVASLTECGLQTQEPFGADRNLKLNMRMTAPFLPDDLHGG